MVTVNQLMADIRTAMDAMPPARGYPVRVIVSPHATELAGHMFEPIRWSPHRSRRIWKKLVKRQRRTIRGDRRPCAYMLNDQMIVHPALRHALEQHTTR